MLKPAILSATKLGMILNAGTNKEVEAFRDINFQLSPRETISIVGPSGCGKSTLFNTIAGLLTPTAGEVYVGGERVDRAAGHVGYMLQKELLLPCHHVVDNV